MGKQVQSSKFKVQNYSLPIALFITLIVLFIFTYQVVMADKFLLFTFVGDTNISFLTQGQAIKAVESTFQKRQVQKLTFNYPQNTFTIDLATSSADLDYSGLDANFVTSHTGLFWDRIRKQFQYLIFSSKIYPKVSLSLDKQLDIIASAIDKEPENAQLIFDETPSLESSSSSRIQIKDSKDGLLLNKDAIQKTITDYLLFGKYQSILPTKNIPPKITTNHVVRAKLALEKLRQEPIKLAFEKNTWFLDIKQLLTLLDLETGQNLLLDKDKTYYYLGKIALEIDSQVQEGLFEFNPQSKRVTAFRPSQEGRKLDLDKTYQLLTDALTSKPQKLITLPVSIIKPKIQTGKINDLGIKELLGRGISNFTGSIPNRIYNLTLAASRFNGVLIPPDETFSFNDKVGDISASSGYKQAYVIKEGRTVLDDGGGVCQDSTTLFRAVLNAGLPIVARTAHAYRVGYYEQGFPPGLDATVFAPSVDFKFKNDTGHHILIQAYTQGLTLYVDLYGTSDGRVSSLTTPIITNQTPPPPELRQDDPTLPKGTIKQVDWAAWGANVTFNRTVVKNGETIINETWRSNYKPWQAIYLVGTKEN